MSSSAKSGFSEVGPTRDPALREVLEAHGLRYTGQREAVYRFLAASEAHPTAEDVFRSVRSEVPAISLATVYKNLETLVACGLAVKLSFGDGSARYDGRTDQHHHARCLSCETVFDLPGDLPEAALASLNSAASGFQVVGHRLELQGYCAACAQPAFSGSRAPVASGC